MVILMVISRNSMVRWAMGLISDLWLGFVAYNLLYPNYKPICPLVNKEFAT